MNVRHLMMRSPRPSYGRVSGIYAAQGIAGHSRLGYLTGGQRHLNPYSLELGLELRVKIRIWYKCKDQGYIPL